MPARIPFIRPSLPTAAELADDLAAIEKANWYSNFGPFELRFRAEIASYLGIETDRVVTVNNATTGLMGAVAQALPRGDMSRSIAIASFTFAAGAHAILWHGYHPSWIDIDRHTLQPSLESFDKLHQATPVSAILLTNTFGIANAQINSWEDRAAQLGIPLIVDSAAGFGSRHSNGELLGTSGDYEVFSFHATKPFAIGEGGAVICRTIESADKLRRFTNFAFAETGGASRIGLNGKLQELNAAIGLRQLATFEISLENRRATVQKYADAISGLPLELPPGLECSSASFAPIICETAQNAAAALSALRDAAVDARNYYSPALHEQRGFSGLIPMVSLTNTEEVVARSVSLPLLPDMADHELGRIVEAVTRALAI